MVQLHQALIAANLSYNQYGEGEDDATGCHLRRKRCGHCKVNVRRDSGGQCKNAGYLFFPSLITDLCVNAGVEMKGEKKSYPVAAFPTLLKATPIVTVASGDPSMLPQFMLQKRAIWEFQRKKHLWLTVVLSINLKEPADMEVHVFQDWIVDEEAVDDVLFEDELNEGVEEDVVVEKKRKKQVKKTKGR